ncbi:MAG: helix-turn-helix domain-containing protein [Planctomycetes bacterium]|nr:helix-turn-helix domain-containing protein [Planctomycetota bacterium]
MENWLPPFYLYHAGRQKVTTRNYYNDARQLLGPRRILIKHSTAGEGVLYVNKKRLTVPAGFAFVIERPGPYVYCYEGDGEPWEFEFLSIRHISPGALLPIELRNSPVFRIDDKPDLLDELKSLIDLRTKTDYTEVLSRSALAYRFILSIIASRVPEAEETEAPHSILRKALERDYLKNFSISHFAKKIGKSQEFLTRSFTKAFGVSPARYAKRLKINKARRLLEQSDLPNKQIAIECGFSDTNYFTRSFRQTVGVTPGEYRKNPDPLL